MDEPDGHFQLPFDDRHSGSQAWTDEQKDFGLRRFMSGEMRGGLGLNEPGAWIDQQAIRPLARWVRDNYAVNGTKACKSNAIARHVVALLVNTDSDTQPRHNGIKMLIVPKNDPDTRAPFKGVSHGKKREKLG
jgi:alkylation response protein AidB-like acyl-CoA dehydrogenase